MSDFSVKVDADSEDERLDKFLAENLGRARNQVQRAVRDGLVLVNERTASVSQRLTSGDTIRVPEGAFVNQAAEELPEEAWLESIGVLETAADWVVLNKPAPLAVHPGAGREYGTLANFLVQKWPEMRNVGHPRRPGIVHRLDLGTTGVMVVARTEAGYQRLSKAFADRSVQKTYLAIVYGVLKGPVEIELPIARHLRDRRKMAVRATGRPARSTVIPIVAAEPGVTLVAVKLHTGRTHQIRVHLKASKHPLVGDPTYGEARWREFPSSLQPKLKNFERPALHSWRLAFSDPSSGQPKEFEAPLPADMSSLWTEITEASKASPGSSRCEQRKDDLEAGLAAYSGGS